MKNLEKILGVITFTIGAVAICAIDSDIPLWGTALMGVIGVSCFIGGCVMYSNNSNQPIVD